MPPNLKNSTMATGLEKISFHSNPKERKFQLGQFSSVTQLCPILCDFMDRSTSGFPVHHQLPEFTQTYVHWVSDAIQPSHLLSLPSPPTFNLSQHQGFSNESTIHIFEYLWWHLWWPKYWSFSFNISPSNEYSVLISFKIDWFDLLCSPRDSQESSLTSQFESISSLALSFLYPPTLTPIHDYWKNHSLD